MDKVILTPRLKLVLLDAAALEHGSAMLDHMHIVRISPEANSWSLSGPSKSLEETRETSLKRLPESEHELDLRQYRLSYLAYKRNPEDNSADTTGCDGSSIIGVLGFREPQVYGIPFPDQLTIPEQDITAQKVLIMEAGYGFLPTAWGFGYGPESLKGLCEAFQKARHVWGPSFEKIYIRAIIGPTNPRSVRVVEKAGFTKRGLHVWDGEHVFIGGAMQPPEVLVYSYGPF